MKKLFSRVFVCAAACLLLTMAVSAASSPRLTVNASEDSVSVGDTFSVSVKLDGSSSFDGIKAKVQYDTDVLTCTSLTGGSLLTENDALFTPNLKKAQFSAISVYPITENGTLLELTFRAKAPGSSEITVDLTKMISDDYASSDVSVRSAYVDVLNGNGSSVPEELPEELPEVTVPEQPSVEVPDIAFSDVPTTHWAYTYIQNAVKSGLFSGTGNGKFSPAMNVTRGMFVTTLYSSAGSPDVELSTFTDVPANAWYAKAVAWASQQGIVSGIGNNKFGPDLPITREQIALILFNYADGVSPGTEMFVRMAYPDAKDIHDWALTAFTWAMNKELISGKSGNILDPLATATRAEVAVIMQNFVNLSK